MNILTKLVKLFSTKQIPAPKASHAHVRELGKATAFTLGGLGHYAEKTRLRGIGL
jgi:hypothetical protein